MSHDVARTQRSNDGQSTAALPGYFRSSTSTPSIERCFRSWFTRSPIDQGGVGPPHGMRRVLKRVETDAANPLRYQPGVLSRGEMRFRAAATGKQALLCIPTA